MGYQGMWELDGVVAGVDSCMHTLNIPQDVLDSMDLRGVPLISNEHTTDVIGRVTCNWTDNKGQLHVHAIIPGDDHESITAKMFLDEGASLSLASYADTHEVNHVSLCIEGRRPGTFVMHHGRVPLDVQEEYRATAYTNIEHLPPLQRLPPMATTTQKSAVQEELAMLREKTKLYEEREAERQKRKAALIQKNYERVEEEAKKYLANGGKNIPANLVKAIMEDADEQGERKQVASSALLVHCSAAMTSQQETIKELETRLAEYTGKEQARANTGTGTSTTSKGRASKRPRQELTVEEWETFMETGNFI